MAYGALLLLTQTIDQILRHDYHPISVNGKQQLETLRKQAIRLQEFLKIFPKKAVSLETRIRDTANQAEDAMEHFVYEHTRPNLKAKKFEALGRAVRRTDIEYDFRELENVTSEINSIVEQAAAIEKESGGRPAMKPSAASSASTIDTVAIGLEEKVEDIRRLLCEGQLERRVIPITGMGGIGKTTLARVVYNDDEVTRAFPLRAWMTVSQNYKPENIFAELLFSLEKNKQTKALVQDGDTTEEKLHKILTTMKYLIVLDDLWSEKAWDDINKVFGNPRKRDGSRIVITTRNEKVASHADSTSRLQKMDLMDEANSWALFKHKVFPHKEFPSHLVAIGMDISKNCEGLPLAIVLVANILSTIGESLESWELIAEDVASAIREDGVFDRIMSLSYTHLPLHLRPCFLFMSSFPEENEILVSKLIKLWLSEGFVESEDEAEGYLNDLMNRNLVSATAMKSNGKVKSCDVHDILRDLLRRVAVHENYEHRISIACENNKRRLNITRENSDLVSFLARLPNPEGAAYALQNLLTLSVVKKLICTEKMMKVISNVKKLGITYFGDRYKEDYQLQNLVLLQNLEKLTLIVKKGSPLDHQKAKPVFPKTLRWLNLSGWRFPWADMKAVASLPHLQVLKLRDHACEGDTWDTYEESDEESDEEADLVEFRELEHLLIGESDLQEWVMDKYNFPRLKRLVVHGCRKLSKIPKGVGNIASLELIEVDRANMSLVECVRQIHKEQKEDYGNTTLRVRVLKG